MIITLPRAMRLRLAAGSAVAMIVSLAAPVYAQPDAQGADPPDPLLARSYPVLHLLDAGPRPLRIWAPDHEYLDEAETGEERIDLLLNLVRSHVHPNSWAPAGDAELTVESGRLDVKATAEMHRELADLLAMVTRPPPPGNRWPGDRTVARVLGHRLGRLGVPAPMPLERAIAQFADLARPLGGTVEADWRTLEALGVTRTTELVLDIGPCTLGEGLQAALDAAIGRFGLLTVTVRDGRVVATTADAAGDRVSNLVYNIDDVIAALLGVDVAAVRRNEGDYWWCFGSLIHPIRMMVTPNEWAPAGEACLAEFNRLLVVRQSARGHRELGRFLDMLRDAPAPGVQMRASLTGGGLLTRPIGPVRFQGIGLENAYRFLRDLSGVPMRVNWWAMEAMGITRTTEVSLEMPPGPLGERLNWLNSVAAGREGLLGVRAETGGLVVSTADDLAALRDVRVYDVRDLLAWLAGPNADADEYDWAVENLLLLLRIFVRPDDWAPGGESQLVELLGRLVVQQTDAGHQDMSRLLWQLRAPPRPGQSEAQLLGPDSPLSALVPWLHLEDVPLEQAIRQLQQVAGGVYFRPNWGALAAMGVTRLTPVSMTVRNLPLRRAIRLLLDRAGGRPGFLDYSVSSGVVVLTTADDASALKFLRVYNVSDLLVVRDRLGQAAGASPRDIESLIRVLREAINPAEWAPSGDAQLAMAGDGPCLLLVKQSWIGHEAVAELLELLRAQLARPAAFAPGPPAVWRGPAPSETRDRAGRLLPPEPDHDRPVMVWVLDARRFLAGLTDRLASLPRATRQELALVPPDDPATEEGPTAGLLGDLGRAIWQPARPGELLVDSLWDGLNRSASEGGVFIPARLEFRMVEFRGLLIVIGDERSVEQARRELARRVAAGPAALVDDLLRRARRPKPAERREGLF